VPLDGVLDRQLDQLGMDPRSESPHDLLLDRVGLAADPRREVPAPPWSYCGKLSAGPIEA
jgi:hypothetical protein